ncbi:conserved hypothetical protein [metagenome]|uniref:Uncharacterized protein n=1 Tax=metagenome TaxID=256318 RepID=A0A2P2C837_9ZZZZ
MYGQNSGRLRGSLGVLLREHRVQQRLGGKGIHTVPATTTVTEREELGKQIRRYRECVLTWCLQAVRAAHPRINLEGTSGRSRGPADELRYRLSEAINASTAGLAPSEELGGEQRFASVESWRHAARAAALGEQDFAAGVGYGRLSDQQCITVLKDAADIVRGVVALDRRYEGVPGWKRLKDQGRLGRAAEVCAAFAGSEEPDYTVDLRGWRTAPVTIDGPAMPGITGLLQAEHNLLVHLGTFPDARSLRVVLDSQRIVSRTAATLIEQTEPPLSAKWRARETTYGQLVHQTRDLGGMLGQGGHAAGQGAVAASRVKRLATEEFIGPKLVRQLDRVFSRIDEQISQCIEHGAKERLYFLRVPFPRIDENAPGFVKRTRERYTPITSPVQTDLIVIARSQLRPAPITPWPPKDAAESRAEFEAAIMHRPGGPGPSLSL